jgi:hypothetical protein
MRSGETQWRVDSHFEGKGASVRGVYDALIARLSELGDVVVEPKKTCLHLVNRTALAGVYPRKDVLQLEFKTDYAIDDPLIIKSEQISRSRWHHIVRVARPEDLDGKIIAWIRDAFVLSA